MAGAPGHRLGQIIGDTLEATILPLLQDVADKYQLFLDSKGPRPTRPGVKLTWVDDLENKHDLDFVLERGATAAEQGLPAAFIESAWRRYTKHSRAKAQEIQGALIPLLATHSNVKPFAGAVVAGEWTAGALKQLRSSGFSVLHIDYADIITAFAAYGMDVRYNEETADAHLQVQVDVYEQLGAADRVELAKKLINASSDAYAKFKADLERHLSRRVKRVVILYLYGSTDDFESLTDAISALEEYAPSQSDQFSRFEIQLTYDNDDSIDATFSDKDDALDFLGSFA